MDSAESPASNPFVPTGEKNPCSLPPNSAPTDSLAALLMENDGRYCIRAKTCCHDKCVGNATIYSVK